jgi:hypothetical protein
MGVERERRLELAHEQVAPIGAHRRISERDEIVHDRQDAARRDAAQLNEMRRVDDRRIVAGSVDRYR